VSADLRPPAGDAAIGAAQRGPSLADAAGARASNVRAGLRLLAMALAGAWAGYFLFTGMPQLTLHVFPRTLTVHIMVGAVVLVYLAYLAVVRRLPQGIGRLQLPPQNCQASL